MDTFKAPQEISESDRYKQKFPGRAAPKQSDFLRKRLQGKGGGKYFDSGDYNMAKSKKDPAVLTGKAIPTPEAIPHRKPSCSQSNLLGQPADGSIAAVEEQPLPPSDESMEK